MGGIKGLGDYVYLSQSWEEEVRCMTSKSIDCMQFTRGSPRHAATEIL